MLSLFKIIHLALQLKKNGGREIKPISHGIALSTFPVSMITPTELSSLASLKARISSFIVCGRKAFLLSGRLIVICRNKEKVICLYSKAWDFHIVYIQPINCGKDTTEMHEHARPSKKNIGTLIIFPKIVMYKISFLWRREKWQLIVQSSLLKLKLKLSLSRSTCRNLCHVCAQAIQLHHWHCSFSTAYFQHDYKLNLVERFKACSLFLMSEIRVSFP